MAPSYSGLIAEIKKLQQQADRIKKGRSKAITQVNSVIAKFGIAASELVFGGGSRKRRTKPAKTRVAASGRKERNSAGAVAPKYRGPGGAVWSGRGRTPVWMRDLIAKGKKKEDFLIKAK